MKSKNRLIANNGVIHVFVWGLIRDKVDQTSIFPEWAIRLFNELRVNIY